MLRYLIWHYIAWPLYLRLGPLLGPPPFPCFWQISHLPNWRRTTSFSSNLLPLVYFVFIVLHPLTTSYFPDNFIMSHYEI
jgi:hypothetical protein